MNFWKILTALALTSILVLFIVWANDGYQIFSSDKSEKVTIINDPIFNENHEKREWVDEFHLGLLPDDTNPIFSYRSLLIPTVVLMGLAFLGYRKSRSTSNNT